MTTPNAPFADDEARQVASELYCGTDWFSRMQAGICAMDTAVGELTHSQDPIELADLMLARTVELLMP